MKSEGKKVFFEESVTLPKDSGYGVKLGDFRGEESFPWQDITAPIEIRGVAATDPSWARIGSTSFWAYKFAIADYVWQVFHVPHDIVPGSDIHFHVHWLPATQTSPLDTGFVTWEFEYAYAKGFNQGAFDFAHASSPQVNSGTVYATDQLPSVQYQHMVSETAAVSIPGMTEPDGLIYTRLGRVNNQTSPLNNATQDIFVLTADIHYQSTGVGTKGKAPNFYS